MKIYTKTGDAGTTGLVGGGRVKKSDLLMETIGTLDELNAWLGLTCVGKDDPLIQQIQSRLFDIGAELATPSDSRFDHTFLTSDFTVLLEESIDRMETDLEPLRTFILPGGSEVAARLHLARTVCRRAERLLVQLGETHQIRSELFVFLNRLSDWLFVKARYANRTSNVADIPWEPKKS